MTGLLCAAPVIAKPFRCESSAARRLAHIPPGVAAVGRADRGVYLRGTITGGEQSGSSDHPRGCELRHRLYAEAGARESLGIIGEQQMFAISCIDPLGSDARRYHRYAVGKSLQDFDPGAVASFVMSGLSVGEARAQVPNVTIPALPPIGLGAAATGLLLAGAALLRRGIRRKPDETTDEDESK